MTMVTCQMTSRDPTSGAQGHWRNSGGCALRARLHNKLHLYVSAGRATAEMSDNILQNRTVAEFQVKS